MYRPADLLHYVLRPAMPLPAEMLNAVGVEQNLPWWKLTDAERDQLWERCGPSTAVATFLGGRIRLHRGRRGLRP